METPREKPDEFVLEAARVLARFAVKSGITSSGRPMPEEQHAFMQMLASTLPEIAIGVVRGTLSDQSVPWANSLAADADFQKKCAEAVQWGEDLVRESEARGTS